MSVPFKGAWTFGKRALGTVEPVLLTNPAHDDRFRADAAASIHPDITPASLEAALRQSYPRVAVHVRELVHEPFVVWYVYRDGRWLGRDERGAAVDDGSGSR